MAGRPASRAAPAAASYGSVDVSSGGGDLRRSYDYQRLFTAGVPRPRVADTPGLIVSRHNAASCLVGSKLDLTESL